MILDKIIDGAIKTLTIGFIVYVSAGVGLIIVAGLWEAIMQAGVH